jgi:WD40 repeat protein
VIKHGMCLIVQVGHMRGHSQPVNKLLFTPSGNELITASDDHKLKVFTQFHFIFIIA